MTSPADDPIPGDAWSCDAIEHVIVPRARDIGGFEVRRALPAAQRQMVGPFIFFDHMGPAAFPIGEGVDVRPHPHIGLATVTYLFEGEIMHRDSLGIVQAIRPGEVNLMTAGRGIAHSERTAPEQRAQGARLGGIQTWLALPKALEEIAPSFAHHTEADLPLIEGEGKRVRVIMGSLYGQQAATPLHSETIYAEAVLDAGALLPFDPTHEERAIYVVSGEIDIGGDRFAEGRLLTLRPGDRISVRAVTGSRIMLFGGAPMDGPRHIWWNFVSSSKDRIDAAKADWKADKFEHVPGETEFIPLPA
jgi:redox-sensitive bicupin YhaK (pirin superfamily)